MEATTKAAGSPDTVMEPHKAKVPLQSAVCLKEPYLRTDVNRVLELGLGCLSQKAGTVSPLVFADSLDRKVPGASDRIRTTQEPVRFSL